MAAAVSRQIADDLVSLLNQAALSIPFTAERSKRPDFDHPSVGTVKVIVTPRGVELEPRNRQHDDHDYLTEIAVFKLIPSADNADTDPMDDLVQEIADTIRRAPLDNAEVSYKRLAYESLTDADELNEKNLFFALLSIIHRAVR